ncbi:MAG TPA: hemerythrin domain-containing protein [Terracidiphilus sp.]|nr:hemerythrin domain-containing protein [Terracidiphilus sp.]
MAIQIGAKPDSGFDDPIGMLKDCHRRIESFLHILCMVVERAHGRELSVEERDAVQAALQYFRVGGVRHTADEEESLFPRMRARSESADPTFENLGLLESDHHTATNLHALVEQLYLMWIAEKRLSADSEQKLLGATQDLKKLYSEHINLEEQVVFPHAAQVLDRQSIAAMGQEFRIRRS